MAILGFLVNPIAGMGGRVGLKGTDGAEILKKARELGAEPVAHLRAAETLKVLFESQTEIKWLSCSGSMGEEVLLSVGYKNGEHYKIVYKIPEDTSSRDTIFACEKFKEGKVDLILFCGGDGTARDIVGVVGTDIPMIGIPAGVKMFSSVFGVNPKSTADVVLGFIKGEFELTESEIMDIDEEDYRKGNLHSKLFGYAKTPYESNLVQAGKAVFHRREDETAKMGIAKHVAEIMEEDEDTLFILGAGSTIAVIGKVLSIDKTLLGVDAVKNGELVGKDVNEKDILGLLEKEKRAVIIIGVIGAQGFVFGRGNQQLSPKVLKRVGKDNIKIAATPWKISETSRLWVDTGDGEVDEMLSGYYRVIIGYHELRMAKLKRGK